MLTLLRLRFFDFIFVSANCSADFVCLRLGPAGPQAVKAKAPMMGRKTAGRVVAPRKRGSGPNHSARFPACDGQPPLIGARLVPVACAPRRCGDEVFQMLVTGGPPNFGGGGMHGRRFGAVLSTFITRHAGSATHKLPTSGERESELWVSTAWCRNRS
jgi:hypothetical protein